MFEPGSRGWRRSKGGGNGDRGRRGMEGKPASKFWGGEEQLAFPVHFLAQSRTYFSPQVVEIKPGSRCF